MKTASAAYRSCFAALLIVTSASAATAQDLTGNGFSDSSFQSAQSDCYSIGQRVASENGGTLAKASQADQGGQPVCVIVVLVPGKDGQRPRRTEIVVPQQ